MDPVAPNPKYTTVQSKLHKPTAATLKGQKERHALTPGAQAALAMESKWRAAGTPDAGTTHFAPSPTAFLPPHSVSPRPAPFSCSETPFVCSSLCVLFL